MTASPKVRRWLVRQPHFWMFALATFLGYLTSGGALGEGRVLKVALALLATLHALAYLPAATSSPPREKWSKMERAIKGLPPE